MFFPFLCYVLQSPVANILFSKLFISYIQLKGDLTVLDGLPVTGRRHISRCWGRLYGQEGSTIAHALLARWCQWSLSGGGVYISSLWIWVGQELPWKWYWYFLRLSSNRQNSFSLAVWGCLFQWHPTPVLLPGEFRGRRSLVGCSPRGHQESDPTEWLHFHFSLSCTGEGNGSPLQCSCLENPRDGGSWWAAAYGVAQSQTRLKRLSSSSSSRLGTQAPSQKDYAEGISGEVLTEDAADSWHRPPD